MMNRSQTLLYFCKLRPFMMGEASSPSDSLWLASRLAGYAAPVLEYCGGTVGRCKLKPVESQAELAWFQHSILTMIDCFQTSLSISTCATTARSWPRGTHVPPPACPTPRAASPPRRWVGPSCSWWTKAGKRKMMLTAGLVRTAGGSGSGGRLGSGRRPCPARWRQGLTLVHYSAQPEPVWSL